MLSLRFGGTCRISRRLSRGVASRCLEPRNFEYEALCANKWVYRAGMLCPEIAFTNALETSRNKVPGNYGGHTVGYSYFSSEIYFDPFWFK